MPKRLLILLAACLAAVAALALYAFLEARRDPVVREASISLPSWPAGAAPVRVVLLSDIHAGTLATSPPRLARIVDQVNALKPDLILIAGDFTPGHDEIDAATVTAALAPLRLLSARLGVFAVPGNHDHWTGLAAVRSALEATGITLLVNQAVALGPLAIGAVDDDYSRHARTAQVVAAVRRLAGARLVFTHSPDIAPQLPPDFTLLLAGHTHCGQAVIPFYGSLDPVSRYDDRYRCGIVREGGRTVIVTGGIGGSLPLRLNAPPDLWLLTLGR
jgi:predicted MPP superfamily phosphohydrolase